MEQHTQPEAVTVRVHTRLERFHEFAFALNIVWAVGYALLIYALTRFGLMGRSVPASNLGYYFLRGAARINDLLHLNLANSVTTAALARQLPGRWGQVGQELAILLSVLAASFILYLLVRLISRAPLHRLILGPVAGLSALFAAPISYLYISGTLREAEGARMMRWPSPQALLEILAGEIVCLVILVVLDRLHPLRARLIAILLLLHYGIWAAPLWMASPGWIYRLLTPRLLLMAFPMSGAAWLLWMSRSRPEQAEAKGKRKRGIWRAVGAVTSLATLLLIWLPGRSPSLARTADLGSMTVELSRGVCYGTCPSYRIVIHGSGQVEYFGGSYVRVRGHQTAALGREQVRQVLRELDATQFFALEDRAFTWCFDTSSVSLSVSSDGRTKRVTSDAGCVNSPIQARFVGTARAIDQIVGSDRWVKCDGYCR